MLCARRTSQAARAGDQGQAVTWLLVVGMLAMGMLAMQLALPLAEGGDRLGTGQTSAEAAALAGAERGAEDLLDDLSVDDLPGGLPHGCTSLGEDGAADLADRNGGQLTSYCYDVDRSRVAVTVRSARETGSGHRVSTEADASWGFDWASCRFDPMPTPSPTTSTPTPTPTATPTPTEPTGPIRVTLRCEDRMLEFSVDPDSGRLRLDPADQLEDVVRPRLVR